MTPTGSRHVSTTQAARCSHHSTIRAARESTASVLEALSEAEWEAAGTHSEMGEYSIDTWLEIYAAHCHDHADKVRLAVEQAG